jgi:hypothetical protein
MEILRTISLYIEGRNMPFAVIGGHAVNAHGVSRQTATWISLFAGPTDSAGSISWTGCA